MSKESRRSKLRFAFYTLMIIIGTDNLHYHFPLTDIWNVAWVIFYAIFIPFNAFMAYSVATESIQP